MPNLRSVSQVAPMSMTPAITPVHSPTRSTQTQPDQASCAPLMRSRTLSFFLPTIYLCLVLSLAMSLCQSIVWKSSYWPSPGISSLRLWSPPSSACEGCCDTEPPA